jgi:hypothetical protein
MNRPDAKGNVGSVVTSAFLFKAVIAVEMKLTPYRSLYQSIRLVFYAVFYAALLLATFVMPQRVRAHGGVIIDSGFTSHFEWLASINPYPVTTGEATITLLVFDITNYDPVNDLQATLYVTGPDAVPPSDGVKLAIDPAIYPGDYSANIPLDQAGEWQLRFVVEGGDRSFTVTVPVKVAAASAAQAVGGDATPDLAATATVFAQNVALARQQNSPLSALVSPLTQNNPTESAATILDTFVSGRLLGVSWWLWGIIAIIPILMGWILLRSPRDMGSDEGDDEIDEGSASEDDGQLLAAAPGKASKE